MFNRYTNKYGAVIKINCAGVGLEIISPVTKEKIHNFKLHNMNALKKQMALLRHHYPIKIIYYKVGDINE